MASPLLTHPRDSLRELDLGATADGSKRPSLPCPSVSRAPTIVLGDLHLCSTDDHGGGAALERLLTLHPNSPVVFAGDTLDLAAETTRDPAEAVRSCLAPFPNLVTLLRERAVRGVSSTFLAGNHDNAIATPEATRALHETIGTDARSAAFVVTSPWFTRLADGRVHVEHGHVFDPDGAPSHPLAPSPRDDVGIIVMRDFIVPVGGHALVHANAQPPLRLLLKVFRQYGARAPLIIARYISVASRTVYKSGRRFMMLSDRAEGAARISAFALGVGLDVTVLRAMQDDHATPTRARATSTMARLYLDRVLATSTLISGAAVAAVGGWFAPALARGALGAATLGGVALVTSLAFGVDRYGGRAQRLLAQGAERVADLSAAETVIFGHVHVADEGPRYANTSSFAFPCDRRGRSFLLVDADGRVERGFISV